MESVRVGCLAFAPNTSWEELVLEIRRAKATNPDLQILTMTEAVKDIDSAVSLQFISNIFANVAQETKLYLAVTFIESGEEKKFNSIVVFNPTGQLVAHHRARSVKPPVTPNKSTSSHARYADRKFPKWIEKGRKSEL